MDARIDSGDVVRAARFEKDRAPCIGQLRHERKDVSLQERLAPRDFDLIEVPFPDHGEPLLIPNGARERREAPEPDPAEAASSGN